MSAPTGIKINDPSVDEPKKTCKCPKACKWIGRKIVQGIYYLPFAMTIGDLYYKHNHKQPANHHYKPRWGKTKYTSPHHGKMYFVSNKRLLCGILLGWTGIGNIGIAIYDIYKQCQWHHKRNS